ncbi:siderophore-interacting protein [Acetobacter oeni]|uniref:Siderophore-interacting protein n=1 Tax=Acetobacter oeni TaxID=304077 RepID=A0A511XKU9_9PROT|nr:siderophore-interacting protein [Acetobacter oeni]MBB3883265.1 NADPH-dependent ferric siderophore reductase [Acetobacter oeni]NHO19330.1 siderophore-interacting protein [Acetobacter oeni]GBR07146.1 siderophore-interacting iron utilization protein [Acetobacter oeni LMG 21952]GEN63587.1 siderophore-interacting protein [Acetobacter oeni]
MSLTSIFPTKNVPEIRRIRHELKRRTLRVISAERLTPHMVRVTLKGDDLDTFVSASPDDHIKVFIPGPGGEPARRDYTPRRFDATRRELVLDFVSHEGGPAAAWARAARPGDRLDIGGPRGSQVITGEIDQWVLIGDETALPAIGRRAEETPASARVISVVAVPGAEDEQVFATVADHEARWVHRPLEEADRAEAVLEALKTVELSPRTFVWVAAEGTVARAVRRYLLEERGLDRQWLKASGYWLKGRADAAVKDFDSEG